MYWIEAAVIKIQYGGAAFHLRGNSYIDSFGRSAHLPSYVLILEHLIGARDNNVGGSEVSPCHMESGALDFAPPGS